MSGVAPPSAPPGQLASRSAHPPLLAIAAFASLGAGAIHAAAIGVHAEFRPAVVAFALVAAFQIGWGALALARSDRLLALAGAAGNATLVVGWLVARTTGIPFIEGLDHAEEMGLADGLAAFLAAGAVVGGLLSAVGVATGARRGQNPFWLAGCTLAVGVLAVPGMVSASEHGGGDHGDGEETADDHSDDGHGDGDTAAAGDDVETVALPAKPYDPELPIDLSGVDGVTPQQQAAAENMIAVTLLRLPQFAETAAAEAAGFRSIGDAGTGYEHYINWSYINDDKILDPDHPESLVYRIESGQKKLVSAMFMLPSGSTLDMVPEFGGPLTQWHIHDNLCFTEDPEAPRVGGLTNPDGTCNPPLTKFEPVPMIHVWIVPHECGPFAALEGVSAGQVREGEEHLCNHAHGA